MEILALVAAIVAAVLFGVEASRTRPVSLGWIGFCLLTISLIIWHVVANLEPVFT